MRTFRDPRKMALTCKHCDLDRGHTPFYCKRKHNAPSHCEKCSEREYKEMSKAYIKLGS